MTDLMTSLCNEIEKWKKEKEDGTVENQYGSEEEEQEDEDSLSKDLREAVKFMKKFQELLQCKFKVHGLLYFCLARFVLLTSSST